MIALHIPITAMLIGIVLRVQRRWSTIFGIASFFTPFSQGLTLGALTTGDIHFVGDQVTTGFFAGWLTPFALTCGLFALALFAFLAATYMTVDTQGQSDLQSDFRLRALWAEAALIPLAIIVFTTSKYGAPFTYQGLTNWWAPVLLGWTALSAINATLAPLVSSILSGPNRCRGAGDLYSLGLGPGPISALSYTGCHSPERRRTTADLGAGAVVLLPSLLYLFQIFKGQEKR